MNYLSKEKFEKLINAEYNFIISDRGGRKSSLVQELLIENWIKSNYQPQFCLLRTKTDEYISEYWFSSYIRNKYNIKWQIGKESRYIHKLYGIIKGEKKLFGYITFLSVSKKLKSNEIKELKNIDYYIWEECIPEQTIEQRPQALKSYLKELYQIESIVSTFSRGRADVKIIALGNDIKGNLLNPVTYTTGILDKLEIDKKINGIFELNFKHTFSFYYNQYDETKTPNWFNNDDIFSFDEINKNLTKYKVVLQLSDKLYYIYFNEFYSQVCEKNLINPKQSEIEELSNYINAEKIELYKNSDIIKRTQFLNLWRLNNPDLNIFIMLNYELKWNSQYYYYDYITAKIDDIEIIDIEKIINSNYSSIINSTHFTTIKEICNILKNTEYSNYLIKLYVEELKRIIARINIEMM